MSKHRVVSMEDILSGKVSLDEFDEKCTQHDQEYRYYCKDEKKAICQDCVILKVCPTDHDRITIDEAAQIKSTELDGLIKESADTLKKYQEAVKATAVMEKDLEIHSQIAKDTLVKTKHQYIDLLEKTAKKYEEEIEQIKTERMNILVEKKNDLTSTVKKVEKVNNIARKVLKSGSNMGVISTHAILSTQLQELSCIQPQAADKALVYVKLETAVPEIETMGQLLKDGTPGERWTLAGQFSTGEFNKLHGLALDQHDNIVVCSWEKGVKVFSRDGQVKNAIYGASGAMGVTVTPDNRYHSLPKYEKQMYTHDSTGILLHTTPLTSVNNAQSYGTSLAVDKNGKIVVGQAKNTISIHNADGSLISQITTQSLPYCLACTSSGEIVSTNYDTESKRCTSVQLMDYSGDNIRVIKPPTEIKVWCPTFVCCSRQGEIYVANPYSGDQALYRYTSKGDYLGCVTTEVRDPRGITMSRDGMQLFVVNADNEVQIFQRPF